MTLSNDLYDVASSLYDGGWRKEDRQQLITEYAFSNDDADTICEYLEEFEKSPFTYGVCSEHDYFDDDPYSHINDKSDWADTYEDAEKMALKYAKESNENYTIMKYYVDGGDCFWPCVVTVEPDGSVWSNNEGVLEDIGGFVLRF